MSELGFKAVFLLPGMINGRPWHHRYYDPLWAECERLGVPVCAQLGAAIDFVAGEVSRAPRWVRRTGLEWVHRLALEPRRLGGRYFRNALFLARNVLSLRVSTAAVTH